MSDKLSASAAGFGEAAGAVGGSDDGAGLDSVTGSEAVVGAMDAGAGRTSTLPPPSGSSLDASFKVFSAASAGAGVVAGIVGLVTGRGASTLAAGTGAPVFGGGAGAGSCAVASPGLSKVVRLNHEACCLPRPRRIGVWALFDGAGAAFPALVTRPLGFFWRIFSARFYATVLPPRSPRTSLIIVMTFRHG